MMNFKKYIISIDLMENIKNNITEALLTYNNDLSNEVKCSMMKSFHSTNIINVDDMFIYPFKTIWFSKSSNSIDLYYIDNNKNPTVKFTWLYGDNIDKYEVISIYQELDNVVSALLDILDNLIELNCNPKIIPNKINVARTISVVK